MYDYLLGYVLKLTRHQYHDKNSDLVQVIEVTDFISTNQEERLRRVQAKAGSSYQTKSEKVEC